MMVAEWAAEKHENMRDNSPTDDANGFIHFIAPQLKLTLLHLLDPLPLSTFILRYPQLLFRG